MSTQPEKVTGSSHDGKTGSKIPEEMMEMTDTEFIAPVFIQRFNLRAVVEVILHDIPVWNTLDFYEVLRGSQCSNFFMLW